MPILVFVCLLGALAFAGEPAPAPLPLAGTRWITYYGNPLSKRMGILGEIPPEEMMNRLAAEAQRWRDAEPGTRVQPALELVATVASDHPGEDGKHRNRMDDKLIEKVLGWSRSRGWPLILDIQIGHSTTRIEVERLRRFLEMPDVHLALDPEFDMPRGVAPGRRIGSTDGEEVNVATILLARIVEEKRLPPKLLLVHRFTEKMLTRRDRIRLDPRVQIAVIMDGFGEPSLKKRVYRVVIRNEPVQFAGIKLFYKNDKPVMSPAEVLALEPRPSVVIYQ